ncbi:manganese-dependent ADP-ribose/CDP-alcohol diphosphatase [Xenopus laevis]|uniref:Manganese-dependent ADP-ribose/CDP-alcohol diphosphatase n=2 Tax=Xenopus laevis TaxID=8355 RepID=A0A1L8EUV8_XENLA|nr:manganese-dependent ADP-ribose/CDP-alcohol diphosphatase [Xenopus laevis]XP_041432879.1 manganese-dependent ADP-ribose/CDP-alcohol diphosphatase [Xenopus laevis]OCT63059.1 hypothetical protein XELAEV_18044154mg [Xenopus laevis]
MEDKDHIQTMGNRQPYFTFGVIADIQYADRPTGPNCWGTLRYYRDSLVHLSHAVAEWNSQDSGPTFVLQLGDIIDSSNKKLQASEKALQEVLKVADDMKGHWHHVWGNHELYNFNRSYLIQSKLNTQWLEDPKPVIKRGENADYYAYHFSPFPKFRFVVIDTYDHSSFGRDMNHPKYKESVASMSEWHFPKEPGESQVCKPERHVVNFNGGVGRDQLSWLHNILTYSDEQEEKVVVASHVPIHPEAQVTNCLAWNYREILEVLHCHSCVVSYIAGHEHHGGYCQDSHGIHHITMEGVVESPPNTNAFATVHMYKDKMVLHGRGRVKSRELKFV